MSKRDHQVKSDERNVEHDSKVDNMTVKLSSHLKKLSQFKCQNDLKDSVPVFQEIIKANRD